MKNVFFRFVGITSLLFGALLLYFFERSLLSETMDPNHLVAFCIRLVVFILLLVAIGIGILNQRKWAAIVSSIFYAFYGVRLYYDVASTASGRIWLVILLSIPFFIPLLGTIKFWRDLKPGGHWYF